MAFTVFALPQDIEGLTVDFYSGDAVFSRGTFKQNNEDITFKKCWKHRLYGIALTAVSAKLPELSDGISGLYVMYTDRTFTNPTTAGKPVTFKYKYLPNILGTTVQSCTFEIMKSEGAGHSISGVTSTGSWSPTQSGPDSDGWYTVSFNVLPSSTYTSEAATVFRVIGTTTYQGAETKLFRNITVRLLPTQTFISPSVTGEGLEAGNDVTISLTLPNALPESLFPIDISVQDSELALNPRGTDMPCVTHDNGVTFHFVRSVTWSEYSSNKTISCDMRLIQDVETSPLKITISNEDFTSVTLNYSGS